ncbi:MAG: hypothetical protein QHH24_06035 [Candidatus Bathyarchaeota archaeon]|jgi:hypothetical protein|nr:hypothetical protein [Candidatus Bathyarchaeota archaeon]
MKKMLIAVGTLMVISGLIYGALANYPNITIPKAEYKDFEKQWTVAWNYSKGDNLSISFRPHNDWSIDPGPQGLGWEAYVLPPTNSGRIYPYVKTFEVNVTGPASNFTFVEIFIIVEVPNGGVGYMSVFPEYFAVMNNTNQMLAVEKGYPQARFIEGNRSLAAYTLGKAPLNGTYTLKCSLYPEKIWNVYVNETGQNVTDFRPPSPPEIIRLYREAPPIVEYPFRTVFALPVAVSCIAVGGVIAIIGTREKKQSRYKTIAKTVATRLRELNELLKTSHDRLVKYLIKRELFQG